DILQVYRVGKPYAGQAENLGGSPASLADTLLIEEHCMSEQPRSDQGQEQQQELEQPVSDRAQEQQQAKSENIPSEDFEAGVLAQLDSLYRTARRMTSSQQEAEDLVQETMLKAFRFAHTYQPGTNLRAWLFRILNTSAINRYRKQASHPTTTSLPEGEDFYLYNRIKDLSGQELNVGAEEEVLSHYL